MTSNSQSSSSWGLTDSGVVWGLAITALTVIGLLAVIRHVFGSVRAA